MGCLFAIFAGIFPRIALVIVWIATNYVDRAFDGFILPLLGPDLPAVHDPRVRARLGPGRGA